jgi:hypothetical protein
MLCPGDSRLAASNIQEKLLPPVLVIEYSIEIYGRLIVTTFAVLGIWLGLKLTGKAEGHREKVPGRGTVHPGREETRGTPNHAP